MYNENYGCPCDGPLNIIFFFSLVVGKKSVVQRNDFFSFGTSQKKMQKTGDSDGSCQVDLQPFAKKKPFSCASFALLCFVDCTTSILPFVFDICTSKLKIINCRFIFRVIVKAIIIFIVAVLA